jgi:DNA-binding NarL/FixJ family response regulator
MTPDLVLVIDDDAFTLSMVTGVIASSGFIAHGESTAAKGFAFTKSGHPKVAIIDLDLGEGPTGIDLAYGLRRLDPKIGLILLTSYEDPRLHRPNLPDLPTGTRYLVKQQIANKQILIETLEEARNSPLGKISDADYKLTDFTDVQIETLRLVAKGHSNAEIAKLRFVTEKTVEQTITRLAKQLKIGQSPDVNSRVQLARTYFAKMGVAIESEKAT